MFPSGAEEGEGGNEQRVVRAEAPVRMDGHGEVLARWAKNEVNDGAAEGQVVRKVSGRVGRRKEDVAEARGEVGDILYPRDRGKLTGEEAGVPQE